MIGLRLLKNSEPCPPFVFVCQQKKRSTHDCVGLNERQLTGKVRSVLLIVFNHVTKSKSMRTATPLIAMYLR